ncbi:MAG: HDOD domain-containing protein, partial [Rhodothermales bacterium]
MDFKLPPLPNTLGEILQIVSRETPYPDNDRLAKIIQRDPAMTVYVLRQVNSAYYGVRQHVTQIRRA